MSLEFDIFFTKLTTQPTKELKEEWGLERRGAVLERLLDEIFQEDKDNPKS